MRYRLFCRYQPYRSNLQNRPIAWKKLHPILSGNLVFAYQMVINYSKIGNLAQTPVHSITFCPKDFLFLKVCRENHKHLIMYMRGLIQDQLFIQRPILLFHSIKCLLFFRLKLFHSIKLIVFIYLLVESVYIRLEPQKRHAKLNLAGHQLLLHTNRAILPNTFTKSSPKFIFLRLALQTTEYPEE